MKILEVEITNYRQYKGYNQIKLSTDLVKNITIVQGNNGEGKSNLMNAVTWCLYGDEMFKSKMNMGRSIINETALFELKPEETTFVSVAVTLGNNKPEYKFERKVEYAMTAGKPYSELEKFVGNQISKEKGWESLGNPDWIIDRKFIPRDLRGFFFFDGEKMDDYFEDMGKIKSNVEKIAQIDVLAGVISTLTSLKNELGSEMRKYSVDTNGVTLDIGEQETELNRLKKDKENIETDIWEKESTVKAIDDYLSKNSSEIVKNLNGDRTSYETQRNNIIRDKDEIKESQKALIAESLPIIYSFFALDYSMKQIQEGTSKGTLPPNIKDVFVKELLEKGICICGRDLDEDPQCRKNVQMLLSIIVPNEVASDSITGKYMISQMLNAADFTKRFRDGREKIIRFEERLKDVNDKLSYISDKLSAFNEGEISKKESERKTLRDEISRLNVRKGVVGNKVVSVQKIIDTYDDELNNIKSSNQKYKFLENIRNYVHNLINIMLEIKDSIVDDVREQLEEKTREYFFKMIWKRQSFSNVYIIDEGNRYSISVTSEYGQECLGDLSAGEKQVLALSFTAALYSVSGYSVPVFIDTPLARISNQSRENIADYLPDYLSHTQLIMLLTDTEYTDVVRSKLKRGVGCEYKIQHDDINKMSKVIDYE